MKELAKFLKAGPGRGKTRFCLLLREQGMRKGMTP